MSRRAAFSLLLKVVTIGICSAAQLASDADLVRILRKEKFKLVYHVSQISDGDWVAAGVRPQGRSITASMVDPGHWYQSEDYMVGDRAQRQLFLAAKNPWHELLSFWEATHGGPVLRVLMLERDARKPRLIFYAIMHNDIRHERWTWGELRGHILQNRFDVIISAEHPDVYDNR